MLINMRTFQISPGIHESNYFLLTKHLCPLYDVSKTRSRRQFPTYKPVLKVE